MNIRNINQYIYKISRFKLGNLQNNKYLILDIESTGLNTREDDIIEIAIMPIINRKKKNSKPWSTLIRPEKLIPKKIEKLTHITNSNVKDASNLKPILEKIVENYGDFVWVAQCGFEFDFPLLKNKYKELFDKELEVQMFDTKFFYSYFHREEKNTISTNFLIERYKINDSKMKRHSAGGDVEIITKIFFRILKEYQNKGINKIDLKKPLSIKKFVPKPL